MKEIKPPKKLPTSSEREKFTLFLAGSIEEGTAILWQDIIIKELDEFDINILNPRRDKWDKNWLQSIKNPSFNEQVTWELDGLDMADLIVLYLVPDTKSPISLLELGLYASQEKLVVCCPDGFWRKGNVDIVCDRYNIPVYEDFDELILNLKETLKHI